MTIETDFQSTIIKEIKKMLPDSCILLTDANYIQGLPDLLILHNNRWAFLECKRSKNSTRRPNQEYYVNKFNNLSYASFIYPENKEEVLNELQRALASN